MYPVEHCIILALIQRHVIQHAKLMGAGDCFHRSISCIPHVARVFTCRLMSVFPSFDLTFSPTIDGYLAPSAVILVGCYYTAFPAGCRDFVETVGNIRYGLLKIRLWIVSLIVCCCAPAFCLCRRSSLPWRSRIISRSF